MDLKKRSIQGFMWNHLAKLSDYTLTYLLAIIAARLMGKEKYSVYVTLMSIAASALMIGAFGLDEALNKFISQLQAKKENKRAIYLFKKLLSTRLVIITGICLLIYLFRNNLGYIFKNSEIVFFIEVLIFYIFSQSIINFFSNYFTAILNTKLVFFVNSSIKVVNICATYLILKLCPDIRYVIMLFAFTSGAGLISYFLFTKKILFTKAEKFNLNKVFSFSAAAWFNALLGLVLGRYSGVLMLNYYLGKNVQVSYFDVAFTISILLEYIFAAGLVGVGLSVLSELAIGDIEKLLNARVKLIKFHQLLMTPIAVFFLIYPDFLIILFFSKEYLEAVPLLRIYLFFSLLVVAILGSGTSVGILMSIGKQKIANLTRLAFAIVNLILYSLVIPKYKAEGAIMVAGISYLSVYLMDFLFVNKYIGFKYDYSFFGKILLATLFAAIVVFIIPGVGFYTIIGKGILFASVFVTSLIILRIKDPIIDQILEYIYKITYKNNKP
jgi:O-antigen/teichoic acid export membrane protein